MITTSYTAAHRAFIAAARSHGLRPFDPVRVLVALHEHGGSTRSDVLERELGVPDGAMIRRALCERLRPDLERGGDRPGVRTQLVLQPLGYWVVVDFFAEVQLNREEINGRP